MKMKKLLLSAFLCMTVLIAGCGSKTDSNGSADAATSGTAGIGLTYNGVSLHIGGTFADIKSGLGEEIRPSEEIVPCDGIGGNTIEHYYDGVIIGEDMSGMIKYYMIQADEDSTSDAVKEASTDKGLKIGDTADKAKELYGEAFNETDYVVAFLDDTTVMTCGLRDDKTILYLYFNGNSEAGE